MECQAQTHDVGIILAEAQGRGIRGKLVQRHAEEINVKLPVEVMELVVGLSIGGIRIRLFQVFLVVRAFPVDTFPDGEELPVLDRNQGMAAEGTADLILFTKPGFARGEKFTANLALVLAVIPVVPVEITDRGATAGTAEVIRENHVGTAFYRLQFTAVMAPGVFAEQVLPVFMPDGDDFWQGIRFELFVFRGMGIIVSPLPERNISADEGKEPAILLVKCLDD